jgi:hypothetical protein
MSPHTFRFKLTFSLFSILIIGLIFSFPETDHMNTLFVKPAEAVVGRPASPGSVSGVRRRTRRRTALVVGTRVATIPHGHTTVVVSGHTYYIHDGVYYKRYYEGNDVVYVVVEDPAEAKAEKTEAPSQPAKAQADESTKTAEQKLQDLQNLYGKDLITQQEYEAKKKEVLDGM